MLCERLKSEGLAHYSCLVWDQDRTAAIDPRRDCNAYVRAAVAEGLRIAHILEMHRNEAMPVVLWNWRTGLERAFWIQRTMICLMPTGN